MNRISRKHFLQRAGGLFLAPLAIKNIMPAIKKPLLAFSTLGCPDWTLPGIVEFASAHHYDGVEIRGIQNDLDLSKSKHFNSPAAIAETKKMFSDRNLAITDLGASSVLHLAESAERQSNLDEAKRCIDIAGKVGSPYIRVFPNRFLTERSHDETITLISKGLNELGDYAKGTGVKVLMETHGDLLLSDDILKIMLTASNANTGLVWDVSNMWSTTKETPADVYNKLKAYIFHLHIKDLKSINGKEAEVFLGQGNVPIFEAIDIMNQHGYGGYFSFEWEKRWQPELAAPELAFADYISSMNNHFSKKH